jgi:MFS superfamily sulfate permease-like transporter
MPETSKPNPVILQGPIPSAPISGRWFFPPSLAFAGRDIPAGIVVFLVALPLCLGVALASGAPLFAGIISGIVGGIVVALFSGSELSVSGPAAGLAVIVLAAIQQLGSFEAFTLAVLISGALQLAITFLRAGVIGDFIPNMVIKGMLAGIGVVIVLKQIPHALGDDKDFVGDETFHQSDQLNTFTEMTSSFASLSPGAILITAVSLIILVLWDRPSFKSMKWTRHIPAPLLCVIAGTALNELYSVLVPGWVLTAAKHHLVELPVAGSLNDVANLFRLPDFSKIADPVVWKTAATIAVVGSLETLLCIEATDKLDTEKRISDPNTELRAQGIGNLVSGLLGGLPITSVIVRSSANIYAGARTRLSSMVHGIMLLVAALLIPALLNRVPLACLAAILLSVGYKLSSVKIIRSVWKEGWTQFLPFIVTVLAIVLTDLLKGILIGLAVSVVFVMRAYHRTAVTMVRDGNEFLIRFNKDMTFVNKSDLKARLRELPDGAYVIIDGTRAHYVDHDADETLREFEQSAPYRGIEIEYHNLVGRTRP